MKKLLTSIFLLLSVALNAQFGIQGTVSSSWFGGPGNQTYTGMRYISNGIGGGVFYKIPTSKKDRFFVQPEINYLRFGAKNPMEGKRKFSTYGVEAQATAGINIRYFSFEIGGYFNRTIYARNNDFFAPTFGWSPDDWDYYKKRTLGGVAAVSFDFIGLIGKVTYLHGLTNVRTGKGNQPSYNDPKMYGNQDRALNVSICVPFKIKVYKKPNSKPHKIKFAA